MSTLKPTSQPGGSQLKTLDEFTKLCESEYTVHYNAMVEQYKERKDHLEQSRDRKINEFKFLNSIIALNTMQIEGKEVNPAAIMKVEKDIAALNYETIGASFTLDYWRIQYGDSMIIPVLCDVMNYFLKQFQVKEMLTDLQIIQLASKLLVAQPLLRINELVFVLNKALAGKYGPTYQRIGIDTLLEWLNKFYSDSSTALETKRLNGKEEESRGSAPWELVEKNLKRYEEEQRAKKEVNEKVWGIEKRKREIEEHKEQTLKTEK